MALMTKRLKVGGVEGLTIEAFFGVVWVFGVDWLNVVNVGGRSKDATAFAMPAQWIGCKVHAAQSAPGGVAVKCCVHMALM